MRIRIEPPIATWPKPTADRPIVTGHQQFLYHPGILAKYLAAGAVSGAAGSTGGELLLQVVVDQDSHDPLAITLPVRRGDRLAKVICRLGPGASEVPPACRPAASMDGVRRALDGAPWPEDSAISKRTLLEAYEAARDAQTLAHQAWQVNDQLMLQLKIERPRAVFASQMLRTEIYAGVLDAFLNDAMRCARYYNQAVESFPDAGMMRMRVESDRVEVPLWWLRPGEPRRRVFADIADSTPIFVTEDGEPIEDRSGFAPRALLMTALLRHPQRCCLFIHGTGGGAYDRVTEQWWRRWQGEMLAPMAVVTADLHLAFDAPVNGQAALERAVWHRHHVKDNLDRELDPQALADVLPLVEQKRWLLAHMDDDRDRARRREAFDEVHRINAALCAEHAEVIAAADAALARARIGVGNQAIARRRDWFFGLYPQAGLDALRDAIHGQITVGSRQER